MTALGKDSKLRGWLVTIFWLVLGALSGEFIIVPGAGDVGDNRRSILTGFVDPGTWPWQFQVPCWLSSLMDPVPWSS